MRIEALKNDRIDDFLEYCKKHRMELDDSYLYDEDLRDFELNDENPTYIVTGQQGDLIGAVSLMIDDYSKRGRKARFRIFHSEIGNLECYSMMMQTVLKHTAGLDKVFLFVPTVNNQLAGLIEGLAFTVERYSFVLVREDIEVPELGLPQDYEIKPFKSGRDEEIWCEVRNAGFAKLQGSETPITPEMVRKMMADEDNIEGGSMILYHGDRPIGVIRGSDDEYENSLIMNIGPIAILPEYQGKGLGRSLLRASLRFAKEKSYDRTILCVNADNERAKALYIQEGFKQVEAVACYRYDLTTSSF
ncbi:GNAT family N-acetyltransferase [Sporosarcina sp. YIM B06819]|uniref:GNAT family N-acetyltransferase n=1 Tax=Sporosarcina sp. YIM B06819 TaxID=3081769 RepID=UPI00298C69FA|nr:GNAT family N-acetyltransferase [Sporosarcina sp. YIM B06819]